MGVRMNDTWPDGTPKRRPGFNPDVWAGRAPMAKPIERPLQVGDYVEGFEPRRRGVVYWVAVDEDTGEQQVLVLFENRRYGVLRHWSSPVSPASAIDRRATIPRNNRTLAAFTARVLEQLSREHRSGEPWAALDLKTLGIVAQLATLTDQQRSPAA